MIKECINYLIEQEYNVQYLNYSLKRMMEIDEDQLSHCLINGINIYEDIVLYKYPDSSFRCMNINFNTTGRKPICNTIEKKLNEKLKLIYFDKQ